MMKNIEDWEVERKTLVLEEQEMLKATKTFFVQSNLLLNFCKDCHSAFLKGNAEQKRKIVKMVCSNFSYDGSNIVIEPNPIFKAVIKNSLSNKKLPEMDSNHCWKSQNLQSCHQTIREYYSPNLITKAARTFCLNYRHLH